jgi:DNA repair exonuclease SbcCD nuclease subunit
MRFMASGDHHWDEGKRFEECKRVHAWIAAEVRKERPDVFLSGGDIYERASTPIEREAVANWIREVAEVCPVVIAKGNHDRSRDLMLLGRLATAHPVIVEEACDVHVVGGAAIAVVAWPRKAEILARFPVEEVENASTYALRAMLGGLGVGLERTGLPRILLGHFMVDGAMTSVGQPLIGQDMNVGLIDLAQPGAQVGIMAHIHLPQEFRIGDADMIYTGSPFRTAFGEVEDKSIVVGEATLAGVSWERRITPATPMILAAGRWDGSSLTNDHADRPVSGAEVRFRYEVASDQREAARAAAAALRDELLARGALVVKVEESVLATTRARSPEIASARSLADQVRLLWDSKGIVLETGRAERVLSMLAEAESAS